MLRLFTSVEQEMEGRLNETDGNRLYLGDRRLKRLFYRIGVFLCGLAFVILIWLT